MATASKRCPVRSRDDLVMKPEITPLVISLVTHDPEATNRVGDAFP
jgi:hypothetical protein